MKARIERTALAEALGAVKPAVPGDRPVVRLTTKDGDPTLRIEADDRDMGIEARAAAWLPPDAGGQCLVPYRPFAELVSKSRASDIELAADDDKITVLAGKARMVLQLVVGEFIERKQPKSEAVAISLNDWDAIRMVAKATAKDNARGAITGVEFCPIGAAATDSYRVHAVNVALPFTTIAPAKMVAALESEGEVMMRADDRAIEFTTESVTVRTSAIAGEFPKWRDLIDTKPRRELEFDAEALTAAVERVSITSREATDSGRVVMFDPIDNHGFLLRSDGDADGRCEEEINVDHDIDFRFALNSRYLREAVAMLAGDTITLEIADSLKPFQARNRNVLVLLMPVKIAAL